MLRSRKRTSEPEHTMSRVYSNNAHLSAKYLCVGRIVWVGWFLCKSWHIPGRNPCEGRYRYKPTRLTTKCMGAYPLKWQEWSLASVVMQPAWQGSCFHPPKRRLYRFQGPSHLLHPHLHYPSQIFSDWRWR